MAILILIVFVIIVVAAFSLQNAMPVAISFLSWQFNGSLAVIALLFFLAGMVAGMAVLSWTRMRRTAIKKSELSRKNEKGG